MFRTLLIANRGEIACRIIRTARRLAIRTVAVYSEADRSARHVAEADTAVAIGPAPARDSYLRIDRIVAAAQASGAEAVHPGYGFLSENAAFAEACAAAGLVFVGPPAAAIRAMGSKSAARELMVQAGVPIVPGYHGAAQDPRRLEREAQRIGFPVLIKASAGGGGRGMRVVERHDDFAVELASARREAMSAFGDDRMLIEKYLTPARHVEIQIFADSHGNCVHLFERDCSIQRRHQKILEEAPAPGMTAARRGEMAEAAIAAARAVDYVGAGTVEFILAGPSFHFMEMNTRLQVEHPVTEMITGTDLVEWQLRVAAGEALPRRQEELAIAGHAVEARLYAEDPSREFLPAPGTLRCWRPPVESRHVRVETGLSEGDRIGFDYDPLIAKLVVWDTDRAAALRRLAAALADTTIVGPASNLGFLMRLAADEDVAAARLDTGLLGRRLASLLAPDRPLAPAILAAATLSLLFDQEAAAGAAAAHSADPYSPWRLVDAWRLNGDGQQDFAFAAGTMTHRVRVHRRRDGTWLDIDGELAAAAGERMADGSLGVTLDGTVSRLRVVRHGAELVVVDRGLGCRLICIDPLARRTMERAGGGRVVAPMPGRIMAVAVRAGDTVRRGAALVAIEAMKMEHMVTAPADGLVAMVRCALGDVVEDGAELVVLQPVAPLDAPQEGTGGDAA